VILITDASWAWSNEAVLNELGVLLLREEADCKFAAKGRRLTSIQNQLIVPTVNATLKDKSSFPLLLCAVAVIFQGCYVGPTIWDRQWTLGAGKRHSERSTRV
jgi:hypothetical protein